jgi:membrane-bound lytic murein transglycosylase B
MAQNTARKQLSRTQKAIMIVPLALLSGAWTLSLAGFGSATAAGTDHDQRKLPDGTQVPSQAIEAPASVPQAGVIAPGVPRGTANAVVDGASASGIPSAAVSAYQRAAQIINAADKGCHVPWELIAAIGRVESDHGRYGGNVLTAEGVSKPGIYGIALNGKNGTQAIQDTDGGVLDKDTVYDRAVGAMQFIPGTWSVVKVDADGDGKRNPQDIDDSSLATAVYLCSGNDDLGTRKGQEAGVFRYNHSKSYVDLVLRIMTAYQSGDYTAVPTGASGGSVFSPSSSSTMRLAKAKAKSKKKLQKQQQQQQQQSDGGSSSSSGTGVTGGTGRVPGPTSDGGRTTSKSVPDVPQPSVPKAPVPSTKPPSVPKVLSKSEAVAACLAKGLANNPLASNDPFDKCVFNLTH